MAPVSVLILTLNEEVNLPRCLESLKWSDDVVVLDSYSTDRTLEIAAAAGARIVQRRFDNWSAHQNWAVRNIQFRHPWVFYIDADEEVTPELAREIEQTLSRGDVAEAAFRVRRKDMFWGKWLRFSSMYPIWLMRLFRPERVRWERLVNPVAVVDGPEGRLREHMVHHSFNKGMQAWLAKHTQYARFEAEETCRLLKSHRLDIRGLFAFRDPVRRRQALKALSAWLPLRPTLRFAYMYLLRGGILDGWAGLTYCRLMAMYEYMIVLNIREMRRRARGLSI